MEMKCGDFTFTKDRTYKEIIGFFYEPKYICKEGSVIWKEKMCCFFSWKNKMDEIVDLLVVACFFISCRKRDGKRIFSAIKPTSTLFVVISHKFVLSNNSLFANLLNFHGLFSLQNGLIILS